MKKKSFLNYNIDLKKINESIEEFKSFSVAKQREMLIEMLNKNQLYVSLSEIGDKTFSVERKDEKINHNFFQSK